MSEATAASTIADALAQTGAYTRVNQEPAIQGPFNSDKTQFFCAYTDFSESFVAGAKVFFSGAKPTARLLDETGAFDEAKITQEEGDGFVFLKWKEPYRGKFVVEVSGQGISVQLFSFVYV